MEKPSTTPQQVAQWMIGELKRVHFLYQNVVVYDIASRFGEEFTHINVNGNIAIASSVLREFRKLTENSVVWVRGERCWRFRADYDAPGKRQTE